MSGEQTELDRVRAGYVDQIIHHVKNAADYPDEDVRYLVDNLLAEWGAKAYREGRKDMAERIKKLADDWK